MTFTLHGTPVSKGIVIGRACLMSSASLEVDHYVIDAAHVPAEVERFFAAQHTVKQELDTLRADLPDDIPGEIDAFLNVYDLILHDSMLTEATTKRIQEQRVNAEWALVQQLEHLLSYFNEVEDEYLRERKADVQHVVERVLRVLAGTSVMTPISNAPLVDSKSVTQLDEAASSLLSQNDIMIVVAHDISPASMLHFKTQAFGGFITEYGGRTSHTAIAARSLGIPAIVGTHQSSVLIRHNDILIVDGEEGVVIVEPDPSILQEYRIRQNEKAKARKNLQRLAFAPAHTEDGIPIALYANIELPEDVPLALQRGAVGIGLFRTEFLFMNRRRHLPDEEEQLDAYRRVLHIMQGRPVTIRTADIGADKILDPHIAEGNDSFGLAENPALGLRAIRWSLAEPKIFLTQLRAILRASAEGPVKILFPMLSSAQEISQTLARVEQAKQQCADAGLPYDPKIKLGAMIETPAAALSLPIFLNRLDFLSIGTNDLIQYTLAIDRADSSVAPLYNPLHPSVLHLIHHILCQAKQAGVPISICGEMAGDPLYTRLLLGMGLTEFSMESSQLLHVKQEILHTSLGSLKTPMRALLKAYEDDAVQKALLSLMQAGMGEA